MTITLPKLNPWQEDVYNDIKDSQNTGRIYTVKAKRQCGKSILGIVLLLTYAFKSECKSIILEPTLVQCRRVFKQIIKMLAKTGLIKKANEQTMVIEFANGSSIIFKSSEQRERLRGETVTGIYVIDEGAYITDDIYDITFAYTDVHKSPTLIISTPLFTSGYFYEFYNKGLDGKDEFCKSYDWSKYDTSKYLSPEKLEMYRQKLSPNRFLSDYLGEFITEGSYVFGDVMSYISPKSKDEEYAMAIDWANGEEEGDYTWVTMADKNGNLIEQWDFKDVKPTSQISMIGKIIRDHPRLKRIRVEKNSIGAVYMDFLKKESNRMDIEPFLTTNDSKRRIIEQLIEGLASGKFHLLNDGTAIVQFQHYAVDKLKTGYTYNAVPPYKDDAVMSTAMLYDIFYGTSGKYKISFGGVRK